LILKSVPAFKENHSVAASFAEDYRVQSQLTNFLANLIELRQQYFFSQQACLHSHCPSFLKLLLSVYGCC
jgi:hypothetical protein